MKNYNINYKKVTKFTITMYGDKKSIRLNSHEFLFPSLIGPDAVIQSSSDKESWCAGVNEATVFYLKNYRVWYYFIRKRVIRGIVFLPLFGVVVSSFSSFKVYDISKTLFYVIFLLWIIVFGVHLLPPSTVKIRHQNRDIKTVATVVIACATVIGVIFKAIDMLFSN